MSPIEDCLVQLRQACQSELMKRPDEVNLHLSKEEFGNKVLSETHGQGLLDTLELGEWKVMERLGLVHGYYENDDVVFDVPSWNNFIAHLTSVYQVGQSHDNDE